MLPLFKEVICEPRRKRIKAIFELMSARQIQKALNGDAGLSGKG
jgi:hypothetical protein